MEEMIDTLKKYNSKGLACLPIKKDKSPADGLITWKGGVSNPDNYTNAYGIGILCGQVSGWLECIDFDNHFGDAKEVISAVVNTPEIKPIYDKHKFPIESTMNGGYHLVYRCKEVGGNQKLARRPAWKEEKKRFEPDVIIETRGEGGYFVAAPTEGYEFIRNSLDKIPEISEQERRILFDVCRSFNTWVEREKKINEEEKDRPGDIYNDKQEAIEDAKNSLLAAGWVEVRPNIWRRPDKKDGISATFGRVAPNVFYNFSSSAYPFEPETAYKPFQVVALLKHKGDFSAFAKELSAKYTNITKDSRPEKPRVDELLKEDELKDLLGKSLVDTDIEIAKPPVILEIRDEIYFNRLLTLGNFSAITGKGKSKKTFLNTMLLAAVASNSTIQNKFRGNLPPNKNMVMLFDTEQSKYDAWVTAKRVKSIAGGNLPTFECFALREYTPLQRCDIIEYALSKFHNHVGLIAIDGIADLAKAVNDEDEATRVGSLLMRWSAVYNIHIITVIHQNKDNNFATGWLGSMIIKKAEAVIGVERGNEKDRSASRVTCDNIRGVADFGEFRFYISDGLPVVDHTPVEEKGIIKGF